MAEINRTQIVLGVITLVGILGAAVFTNWDKIFNRDPDPGHNHDHDTVDTIPKPDPEDEVVEISICEPDESWSLVEDETFSNATSLWATGSFTNQEWFDVSIVGGKYRWDISFDNTDDVFLSSQSGIASEFYIAVDVKIFETTATDVYAGLMFGRASGMDYKFVINSSNEYTVEFYDGTNIITVIDLTRIEIDYRQTNRLAVISDGDHIKFCLNGEFLGDYKASNFTGGKVGLVTYSLDTITGVLDYDNFLYRRKP